MLRCSNNCNRNAHINRDALEKGEADDLFAAATM
jgi:hypothetical protein